MLKTFLSHSISKTLKKSALEARSFLSLSTFKYFIFIFLLFVGLLGSTSFAENFKGRLELKESGTYTLTEASSRRAYTLNFLNPITQQQIERLKTGDFASVTASVDPTMPSLIHVESVNYVGLGLLKGTWKSQDRLCYEFVGYNSFYVYELKGNHCVKSKVFTNKNGVTRYTYFINPDVETWSLLISNKNSDYLGELMVTNPQQIQIQLFDSESDVIIGTINLRR